MKRLTILLSAGVIAVAVLAGACSKSTATTYTCPMHPEVVQDHPGNCPKCGMKLEPKK